MSQISIFIIAASGLIPLTTMVAMINRAILEGLLMMRLRAFFSSSQLTQSSVDALMQSHTQLGIILNDGWISVPTL
jgi:hypothetical protein